MHNPESPSQRQGASFAQDRQISSTRPRKHPNASASLLVFESHTRTYTNRNLAAIKLRVDRLLACTTRKSGTKRGTAICDTHVPKSLATFPLSQPSSRPKVSLPSKLQTRPRSPAMPRTKLTSSLGCTVRSQSSPVSAPGERLDSILGLEGPGNVASSGIVVS
jgi:hypothetical protein